jgi:hypothetical protein
MKKLVLFISLFFLCFVIKAQEKIEFKPEYPRNKKDTILILGNSIYSKKEYKKNISFSLFEDSWNCKKISFIHFFRNKIKIQKYNGIIYKQRIMDKKHFDQNSLVNYNVFDFDDLKKYASDNKGCNNLLSFLSEPTIYFLIKSDKTYKAYEVLPTVWGTTDD